MKLFTNHSFRFRGVILLLAMFPGAGLALSGCGDDETTTTPAPAPPPPPAPAPAPAPAPEPEPEPEPQPEATPFEVMFSVPDDAKSPFPMVPDDGIGASTAKAEVNTRMMISVNMPAIVSPAFVEGASPIGLVPGPNSPFTYVTWEALQSMVINSGVTFAVQPVEIGANQVPIPIGAATLVTCGPFECAMGTQVPELSVANSPVCAAWDPELELQVGLIDNDVIDPITRFDHNGDGTVDAEDLVSGGVTSDDGIDLGWVTSSTAVMTVKHIFSGVANGDNYERRGAEFREGFRKGAADEQEGPGHCGHRRERFLFPRHSGRTGARGP